MEILIITNREPALVVTSRINKQQQNPMWTRPDTHRGSLTSRGLIRLRLQERNHRKVRGVHLSPGEHPEPCNHLKSCCTSSVFSCFGIQPVQLPFKPLTVFVFLSLTFHLNVHQYEFYAYSGKVLNGNAINNDHKKKERKTKKKKCRGWLQFFARWLKGSKVDTSLTE